MKINQPHIGYMLKIINDKLKAKADMDLKKHNLTMMQSRVLAYLGQHDGKATQKEIEVFLEVAHPTVVGIVSRMEKSGFLITYTDAEDKRNKVVELTEKSHKIGQEIDNTIKMQEDKLLEGITKEQIRQLEELLRTIYKNLD